MAMMAENSELSRAMARLDALTNWENRPRATMRVGLEPMLDLAQRLGDPQKSFRSIHVAGTKGKGSVSALIEAALARAGLRVGRYASPHVERLSERVSLRGTGDRRVLACPRPQFRPRRLRGRARRGNAGARSDLVRPSDRRRLSRLPRGGSRMGGGRSRFGRTARTRPI